MSVLALAAFFALDGVTGFGNTFLRAGFEITLLGGCFLEANFGGTFLAGGLADTTTVAPRTGVLLTGRVPITRLTPARRDPRAGARAKGVDLNVDLLAYTI